MHPQFGSWKKLRIQIQKSLQSKYCDPNHCIRLVAHCNPIHILSHNTILYSHCSKLPRERSFFAARSSASSLHNVTAETEAGGGSPCPARPACYTTFLADRVRQQSANTRSIFCKQVLFSSVLCFQRLSLLPIVFYQL